MFSRIFSFLSLAIFAGVSPLVAFEGKLHVDTFTAQAIAQHTDSIVQLSNEIFKGHPYLYDGNDADYTKHLKSYATSKNAVVSIAFDGTKVIGVATGIPLSEAWGKYQEPFKNKGEDISKIYYLGELLLLPEYRGQGIGQQMVKEVEKYAKEKGFATITAQAIDEKSLKTPAPSDYYSMTNPLQKLGFKERPEINSVGHWTNVNETKESPHQMVYWTKSLK